MKYAWIEHHRDEYTVPHGVLSMAHAIAQRTCAGKRGLGCATGDHSSRQSQKLWPASDHAAASPAGPVRERRACSSKSQASGLARSVSARICDDHRFRASVAGSRQHSGSSLRRLAAKSSVGGRHDLCRHGRRLAVPGRSDGPGEPPDCGLVDVRVDRWYAVN